MCSETLAAYIEILNLLCEIDLSNLSKVSSSGNASDSLNGCNFQSKALLDNRSGLMRLRNAAATSDFEALKSCLFDALRGDIDTACALLEATPTIWVGEGQTSVLCGLYLDVCKEAVAPEAKAIALTSLAELMENHVSEGTILQITAASDTLASVFQHMQSDTINPALANAALLASGPLVSTIALQYHHESAFWLFDQRLRAWGKMMADALHDSNTFDMRMAAACALLSFANGIRLIRTEDDAHRPDSSDSSFGSDASFLPFLLALYATLIDDDEEIREVGAIAAAQVMSSSALKNTPPPPSALALALVAVDAADALLSWLGAHFGQTNEFRAYVTCRLVGSPLVTIDIGVQDLQAWAPPGAQFAEALRVDESLFAVEEQNLFVDEVRETERWAAVFRGLPWDVDEIGDAPGEARTVLIMDSSLSALRTWTEDALRLLAAQMAQNDDGPLGWASNPAAYELCHRVLVCGKVLSELLGGAGAGAGAGKGDDDDDHHNNTLAPLLDRIKEAGGQSRLHGLLMSTLLENEGDGEGKEEK